jgi:hypothetical protein
MKAENAVVIIQCHYLEWILRNKTQASNYKIGDIIVGWLYITVSVRQIQYRVCNFKDVLGNCQG